MDDLRLVTRGDDAALAESANDAIGECFEDGLLRNASVMAPAPALDHAAERLAGVDGLCIGCHVTLAAEWESPTWGPVSPPADVPSLVDDDGDFYSSPEALFDRSPDFEEVVAEMEAQLARLREVGFDVTYADAHMLPERHSDRFAEEFAAFCDREGLVDGTTVDLLPGWHLAMDPDYLLDCLLQAEPGTYLVVGHPAYDDEAMASVVDEDREPGDVAAARADQRRMFTDDRVRTYVRENDVEVLRYDDL